MIFFCAMTMSTHRQTPTTFPQARAVGIVPGGPESVHEHPSGHGSVKLKTEALDEVVLRCQLSLRAASPALSLPWCVFNGGRDVFCDVGNKCIGVEALQSFFQLTRAESLHCGDQFLKTGNDVAARECRSVTFCVIELDSSSFCETLIAPMCIPNSPCIWVTSPVETLKVLEILLGLMGISGQSPLVSPELTASSGYAYSIPELAVSPSLTPRRTPSVELPGHL